MIRSKTAAFALFVVLFLIFWNVADRLYTALIARVPYQFTVGSDLLIPLVPAVVAGYLLFLRKK